MKQNRDRQQMKKQLSALFNLIVFDYDEIAQRKHTREFIELVISEQEKDVCLSPSCFNAFDVKKFQLTYEIAIVEIIRTIDSKVNQEFNSLFTKLLLASGLEYFNLTICRNYDEKRRVFKRLKLVKADLSKMNFPKEHCTGRRINTHFRYAVVKCLVNAFIESLV